MNKKRLLSCAAIMLLLFGICKVTAFGNETSDLIRLNADPKKDAVRKFDGVLVDLAPLIAGINPTNFPSTDLRSKMVYLSGWIEEIRPKGSVALHTSQSSGEKTPWINRWLRNYPHPLMTCSGMVFWAMRTGDVQEDKDGNKIPIYDYGLLPTPQELFSFRQKAGPASGGKAPL